MFIVTLIAADRLTKDDIYRAGDLLDAGFIQAHNFSWVEEGSAADIDCTGLAEDGARIRAAVDGKLPEIDVVVQPADGRRKRLLVADMDSTMITVECIDELADYAGVRAEVAAVTERAMRGELDFEAALDARVALLKGLDEAVIERCYADRVRITPGARLLVRTMRVHGAYCLLVSGGFSRFAERVAAQIGFDDSVSNDLNLADGRITGTVARPIVGAEGKLQAMRIAASARQIQLSEVLAVGDGANDIPMIEAAGLGIAYHAKPALDAVADARIQANDLTALLYAQGYARKDWVET